MKFFSLGSSAIRPPDKAPGYKNRKSKMKTPILVEELEVNDKWQGKAVVATDPKDKTGSTFMFTLEGESNARCFVKGTRLLVERDVKDVTLLEDGG